MCSKQIKLKSTAIVDNFCNQFFWRNKILNEIVV